MYFQQDILYHLNLYHPTTVFIFVPKRSDTSETNNWSNYTNWLDVNQDPFFDASISSTVITRNNFELYRKNIISKIRILFNNIDRLTYEKDETYFTLLQKYQHNLESDDTGIYVYSFSINPTKHEPSGSCNMSRVDTLEFKFTLLPLPDSSYTYEMNMYFVNYNIFRVMGGVGSLVFQSVS